MAIFPLFPFSRRIYGGREGKNLENDENSTLMPLFSLWELLISGRLYRWFSRWNINQLKIVGPQQIPNFTAYFYLN